MPQYQKYNSSVQYVISLSPKCALNALFFPTHANPNDLDADLCFLLTHFIYTFLYFSQFCITEYGKLYALGQHLECFSIQTTPKRSCWPSLILTSRG